MHKKRPGDDALACREIFWRNGRANRLPSEVSNVVPTPNSGVSRLDGRILSLRRKPADRAGDTGHQSIRGERPHSAARVGADLPFRRFPGTPLVASISLPDKGDQFWANHAKYSYMAGNLLPEHFYP